MTDQRLQQLQIPQLSLEQFDSSNHPRKSAVIRCLSLLGGHDVGTRSSGVVAFFVPGRIEILGKHTDYCGGHSLVCAIDRGFVFSARKRSDRLIHITDASSGSRTSFELSADLEPVMGHWSNYPMTAARRIALNFGNDLSGVDIVFESNLPPAAGLSSSSALIVGMFVSIATINQLYQHPIFTSSIHTLEDLAHYCGCIENGSGFRTLTGTSGVGTSGGSQDHTAILCGKANTLSQYAFAPVVHECDIPFPDELSLITINSGVVAEKTGSARERYNAVSQRARFIIDLWNKTTEETRPTLAAILRSGPDASAMLHRLIYESHDQIFSADELRDRLDQFEAENELIPQAADAMGNNDLEQFAKLVERSTLFAVDKLGNQIPEVSRVVEASLAAGAIAASPFGAGFGGSVWAMVRRPSVESFQQQLIKSGYKQSLVVRPSPGVSAIE